MLFESRGKVVYRTGVAGLQVGAVEHDHRARAFIWDIAGAKRMEPMLGHLFRRHGVIGAMPGEVGHQPQCLAGIARAAFCEIGVEPGNARRIDARQLSQGGIELVVAGQQREAYFALRANARQLFGAVTPIVQTSQEARDHDPGADDHRIYIKIDGEWMPQLANVGQPQRRQGFTRGLPGARGSAQIAVRERQQHKIGGRLPEIVGRIRRIETVRLGDQHVHASLPPNGRFDGRSVKPCLADDDQLTLARLVSRPKTVVMMSKSIADALHIQAHGFSGDRNEALDAKNVVVGGDSRQHVHERIGLGDFRQWDDEGIKIVMFVVPLGVVDRWTVGEIILGRRAKTQDHGWIDGALTRIDQLHRPRSGGSDLLSELRQIAVVQKIGLVEDDEIGGVELILIQLSQWAVVFERGIVGPLVGDRVRIVGEAPGGDRRAVDDRDDAVNRHPRSYGRPIEGLDERFRQGQPRSFDNHMFGRIIAIDQGLHGGQKIFGHGAADTPVGELDDIILGTVLDAAAFQDLGVDTKTAEFVDDHGNAASLGVGQQMPHQCCFAGSQEAGNDGRGDLRRVKGRHWISSLAAISSGWAGRRAITTSRKAGERFDGIITPDLDAA